MLFTKRLRDGVRSGQITRSVRIWQQPRVKPGNRYRMGEGQIEVDSLDAIELADITPRLARECGFASVVDLLKTAQHGRGTNVYLVRFHYVEPSRPSTRERAKSRDAGTRARSSARHAVRTRARLLRTLKKLPEAAGNGDQHLSLEVCNKRFGYYLDDHHGDGRLALNLKATPDLREVLEEMAPTQFHVPKYVGHRGWIGLWLDTPAVDWTTVELALREAYLLVAPKRLTRSV